MKKYLKGLNFYSIIVVLFCLSAVFCNDEKTADPGIIYVGFIIIPAILFFYFGKHSTNIKISLLSFCIMASAFISIILAGSPFTSTILKYVLFLWFYVVISSVKLSNDNVLFIFRTLAIVSVFLSCAIIASYLTGNTYYDYGGFRFSLNSIGLDKNPNYVASFINISFFVLYYALFSGRIVGRKKILFIVALVLMFFSFCLTGTRAALLTVSISIISALFFVKQNNSILRFIILTTFVLSVLIVNYWESIVGFSDLFLGGRSMTEDDSRIESWTVVLKVFGENPLFGFGPSVAADIGSRFGVMTYLHNIFLEILVGHGILGTILYVFLLSTGWKSVNKKDKRFFLFFFIVSGFPLMFQNGFMAVNFWRFAILNRILVNNSNKNNCTSSLISQIG